MKKITINLFVFLSLIVLTSSSLSAQSSYRSELNSFFKYRGVDLLRDLAHPLYDIKYYSLDVKYGYVDIAITYVGNVADFKDIYRLRWDSERNIFNDLEVVADGNIWTPAFTLFETVNEILKDSDDSGRWDQIRNQMTGERAVRAFCLYTLADEWYDY